MHNTTKLIVLVENESLFLPNLLAKLAHKGLIQQIIVLSPNFCYKKFIKSINRLIHCFGFFNIFKLVLSTILGIITNSLCRYKFYSIKKICEIYKIPLLTIQKLNSKQLNDLLEQNKGNILFAQVSQKIKPDLLTKGVFWNKHCSLLPSYKGVYPIFWALLNEESELGISIHIMNEKFDEGTVLAQSKITNNNLTFFEAYHRLYDITANLIIDLCNGVRHEVNNAYKDSYYSFPTAKDRKRFQKHHKFGFAFRLHPSIKPQF